MPLPGLLHRVFFRQTLADTWLWWRRTYGGDLVDLESVESRFRLWILPVLGELALSQIRPSDVELMLKSCPRHPQTRNHLLSDLRQVFRAAVAQGLIQADPTSFVRRRRVPLVERVVLAPAQGGALLRVTDQPWRSMFALALYAGLRKGEVLGLQVDDIDRTKMVLHVRRSHGRDVTKNGRWRALPISVQLLPELQLPTSGLAFPGAGEGGRYCCDLRLSRRARIGLVATGLLSPEQPQLGGLRFHDLRHSFATRLAELGAREDDIAWALGHSPGITARYTHGRIERVRTLVDRLDWK